MGPVSVFVVGSGAREHAIVWKLAQSPRVGNLFCAPGNAGTRLCATNLPIDVTDVDAIVGAAASVQADLVVIGPEAPLAAGLTDALRGRGIRVFGPSRAAARLEWSKAWTKQFLARNGIPTGESEEVVDADRARTAMQRWGFPTVIKADGLAAGKGVWVAANEDEAEVALQKLYVERALGDAGGRVLVEQYLAGDELSVLAFSDGKRIAVMPPARDYKRLLDDDRGPNTGGMGGYIRPLDITADMVRAIERTILQPTIDAMAAEGTPFQGILYAGLMLTPLGPRVLEFNARFGDPECELILPLLADDLLDVLDGCTDGTLAAASVAWFERATCCVVLASPGYPDNPRPGSSIRGLDALPAGVWAFHAGTATNEQGEVITAGGRVLALVAEAADLDKARRLVYSGAETIQFDGAQFRRDIARAPAASRVPHQ